MRVRYVCEYCDEVIGEFNTDMVDQHKLGIASLTDDEKAAIISVDSSSSTMLIRSLCDDCIGEYEEDFEIPIANFQFH